MKGGKDDCNLIGRGLAVGGEAGVLRGGGGRERRGEGEGGPDVLIWWEG